MTTEWTRRELSNSAHQQAAFEAAICFRLAVPSNFAFNSTSIINPDALNTSVTMKNTLYSLVLGAVLGFTSLLQAGEAVADALVIKVTGEPKAFLPGQSSPVVLKKGDKVPQGSRITTAPGTEVELGVFAGGSALILPESEAELSKLAITTSDGAVTKQSAVVNLTLGSVVSTLDPNLKAINDYSVRTPKGVAAARGTKYTVTVTATGTVRTFVVRGAVTFFNPVTGQSVDVKPGYAVEVDANGNIAEPKRATGEQQNIAKEIRIPGERVIDITITSPSS